MHSVFPFERASLRTGTATPAKKTSERRLRLRGMFAYRVETSRTNHTRVPECQGTRVPARTSASTNASTITNTSSSIFAPATTLETNTMVF